MDLSGTEPVSIFIPVKQDYWEHLVATSTDIQIALADYGDNVTNNCPKSKMWPI